MTGHDMPAFKLALHRLGRSLGRAVSEELTEDYFNDLLEFSWPIVEAAMEDVRKTARFWPRPAILREACLKPMRSEPFTQLPTNVNHAEERYACDVCQDTGFERELTCDGNGACRVGHCGAKGYANLPHDFTRRCGCRATNPILVRERERSAARRSGMQQEHA
jgi:hypothetical protein